MLTADDPLIAPLRSANEPLIRDELRRAGRTRAQTETAGCLAHAGVEAVVALRSTNDIEGVLLLGRRHGGEVFGHREADALALLGDQLGIAVENARLYTRLQEAKHYNDVLLDNLVTGVVAADTSGRITLCNREALRILHLPEVPDAINRPAADVLPSPLAAALLDSLHAQRGVRDRDIVLHNAAYRERSVRYATALFAGHEDTVTGVLLVLQDTTALRKLEEQVRRSDRLASLGTLAAGMAHEIKNPLVSLKTFVQLLPERYDDLEFRQTFVPLLAGEVKRIDTVVTQLLNFARPSKPQLVPMSLHETLAASIQLVAQRAKAKGLVIARHLDVPHDRVLGDSRLLGQVFVNLLLNAVDATERAGSLTIVTRAASRPSEAWRIGQDAEEWIETQVIDTGTGISPADLPRIFDPFFTTKSNGTGLGLSVAHGIIWDHNGCIDASSTPGDGTVFRVVLPLLARSST